MFRNLIRSLFHGFGFDVVRYRNTLEWRQRLLWSHYDFDLIFDVGANTGQYAALMRQFGFKRRIVSFEPLSSAYCDLENRAKNDPLWETQQIALGDYDGNAIINISKNSVSSSILEIKPNHLDSAPTSIVVDKEEVVVNRIDSIIDNYYQPHEKLFLKIDAQGFEKHVVEGAEGCLDKLTCIQMEVSLVPLYDGETLLAEMISFMSEKGYKLICLEPVFYDKKTGQLLQVDCTFLADSLI